MTRSRVVTVSVTVLTEVLVLVLVLVLVDGASVVVVVVTGSVVVVVVGASDVADGDCVTVCVTPGAGATDAVVAGVLDVVGDVVVVAGLEPPLPVNLTIA
ncbi:conserved exported hypothetical protein [uncultured Mycobacterium sp.]|uniref:Uncharacterized protein n=1 Tax=uncultured Mycobacterium sp. TaxID=171292 RepID=A0A1Y5PGM5_9MYCO|nr:conserved exported hypothetical protein [uncultured Mycobacterium sp.]